MQHKNAQVLYRHCFYLLTYSRSFPILRVCFFSVTFAIPLVIRALNFFMAFDRLVDLTRWGVTDSTDVRSVTGNLCSASVRWTNYQPIMLLQQTL